MYLPEALSMQGWSMLCECFVEVSGYFGVNHSSSETGKPEPVVSCGSLTSLFGRGSNLP